LEEEIFFVLKNMQQKMSTFPLRKRKEKQKKEKKTTEKRKEKA
jgi:hypothetical protein